jgi:iron-sulfur cluster repair protein YtfE (RIC family)
MSRDHVEVHALTAALRSVRESVGGDGPDPSAERELRRLLYGLYALVTVHFAKEEEVYVPLLEAALSPEQATAMFSAMQAAATAAGAAHGHTH